MTMKGQITMNKQYVNERYHFENDGFIRYSQNGKVYETSDNHNDDILKGITLFVLVILFTFIVIIAGIVLL